MIAGSENALDQQPNDPALLYEMVRDLAAALENRFAAIGTPSKVEALCTRSRHQQRNAELVPAQLRVIRIIGPKAAWRCCGTLHQAPAPRGRSPAAWRSDMRRRSLHQASRNVGPTIGDFVSLF